MVVELDVLMKHSCRDKMQRNPHIVCGMCVCVCVCVCVCLESGERETGEGKTKEWVNLREHAALYND